MMSPPVAYGTFERSAPIIHVFAILAAFKELHDEMAANPRGGYAARRSGGVAGQSFPMVVTIENGKLKSVERGSG